MTSTEWRTTLGLSAVYALRMFGLFMVLPAFAPFAARMEGGELALLVGLALGVYGLTQAVCQIPFGMASDRFGRKPVIVAGMLIFAAGSWLAGSSETIAGLIAGRALQGAGAISAAVSALVADSTRPQVRTMAMAILGAGMGASFVVALVAGPPVAGDDAEPRDQLLALDVTAAQPTVAGSKAVRPCNRRRLSKPSKSPGLSRTRI